MNARSMYQENILDHYRHPRNAGELPGAEAHTHLSNPLCGDEVDFYLNYDSAGRVADVRFTGRGCTIAVAASSMLSEKVKGMTKADVAKLSSSDITELLGVEINPARLKCATLGLEAVHKAVGGDR